MNERDDFHTTYEKEQRKTVACVGLVAVRAGNLTQKTVTAMSQEITGYGFANKV